MFTLASPGQIFAAGNLKHWSEELVYWIPPKEASVTWFTGTLKHAGRLVYGQVRRTNQCTRIPHNMMHSVKPLIKPDKFINSTPETH
jgi:hypothetical protein